MRVRSDHVARVTLRLPDDLHQRLRAISRSSGASLNQLIVAALSAGAVREDEADKAGSALAGQVQHIRAALGDLAVELDASRLPPHLRPGGDLPDRSAFVRSLPALRPPLSATILADREDRL